MPTEHHSICPRPRWDQTPSASGAERPRIEANKGLISSVIEQLETHPAMSYTDCYLAEEAHATGNEPLLTFDKKLAKRHPSTQLVPTGAGHG